MSNRVIKRSQALVRFKQVCHDLWVDYNKGLINREKYSLNLYCKTNHMGVTKKEFFDFIFDYKETYPSDKVLQDAYYKIMEHHRFLNSTRPSVAAIGNRMSKGLSEEEYNAIQFLKSRGFRITRLEEKEY